MTTTPADLYVVPVPRSVWLRYAHLHYLSTPIHPAARVYLAHLGLDECGVVALIHSWGSPRYWRISRVVVAEAYQGFGIGGALIDWAAAELVQVYHAKRVSIVTAMRPLIVHCEQSLLWRRDRRLRHGNQPHSVDRTRQAEHVTSRGRAVMSFVYVSAQNLNAPPRARTD